MKAILICGLSMLLPISLWSQKCNCVEKFLTVKHEIETNYSGYKDKVNEQTNEKFNSLTKYISSVTNTTKNDAYCLMWMTEWVHFFKDGHIQLAIKQDDNPNDAAIQKRINETEIIKLTPERLQQLATSLIREEGIYYSADSTYKIAIISDKNKFRDFAGVIVESKTGTWKPGQVKLEMKKVTDSLYETILYYRDHSFAAHQYHFDGVSYDNGNWNKEGAQQNNNAIQPFRFGYKPVQAHKINNNTLYIQIGTFDLSNSKTIDSVFTANAAALSTTPNLILDLRNNGGGADQAYQPIIPYIYTKPIVSIGNVIWSTPDNVRRFLNYLDNPDMSDENKNNIRRTAENMKMHLGTFVDNASDETTTLNEVKNNPKKVVVLINRKCGSTTEEFLLDAMQSSKVTLMGERTYGVLDYSNMVQATMTCSDIVLYYATTKTRRIEMGKGIDETGIKPDIKLSRDKDWINEAVLFLNRK